MTSILGIMIVLDPFCPSKASSPLKRGGILGGDTMISLHTLPTATLWGGGIILGNPNSKCQDLANFSFPGGRGILG